MPGLAVLALFAAALPTAVVLQPVANMYSPMVRIDDLNDAYWTKLLISARRLK